jgi:hypothetical protein
MYRTQLWAAYDNFDVTDEHRAESILNGFQRVLVEDLGAQKSKADLVEPSASSPPEWQLTSKRHQVPAM